MVSVIRKTSTRRLGFSTGYPQLWRVVSWPIVDEKLTMTSVPYLIEAMIHHTAAGIIIC
ncbi:MAG: hypothetical protein VW962_05110 [Acidimicrobiaceae bacterium]